MVRTIKENCIFLDDIDVAGQQAILGLVGERLARAMDRRYSALFTFKGTLAEFGVLQEQAVKAGLLVQCGGRVCALSALHDKASFHNLIRQTAADEGSASILVGFGDAQNDVSMLQNSDVACIIPRPECQSLVLPDPPQLLVRATTVAPLGWLETFDGGCIGGEGGEVRRPGGWGLRPEALESLSEMPPPLVELASRLTKLIEEANAPQAVLETAQTRERAQTAERAQTGERAESEPLVIVSAMPPAVLGDSVTSVAANAPVAADGGEAYGWHIDADPALTPPSPWSDFYGR